MAPATGTLANSRLRRLAQRSGAAEAQPAGDANELCELCGAPIPSEHRHLLALPSRDLVCACRPCSVLFDRDGSGHGRYKLIPERRLRLEAFAMTDLQWEELRIPVEMAFFFSSSEAGRVLAYYPGPMGATESQLELGSWTDLVAANPILDGLEEDVEALLVNRARGARGHWIVPLDACYELVGLIRTRWKGLSGGSDVWEAIDGFFAELDRRARTAPQGGRT